MDPERQLQQTARRYKGSHRASRLLASVCKLVNKRPGELLGRDSLLPAEKKARKNAERGKHESEGKEEKEEKAEFKDRDRETKAAEEEERKKETEEREAANERLHRDEERERQVWEENRLMNDLIAQLAPAAQARLRHPASYLERIRFPLQANTLKIRKAALEQLEIPPSEEGKLLKNTNNTKRSAINQNWMAAYAYGKRRNRLQKRKREQGPSVFAVHNLVVGHPINRSKALSAWQFSRVREICGWKSRFSHVLALVEVRKGSQRKHVKISTPWLAAIPHCDSSTRWPVRLRIPLDRMEAVIWDCMPPLRSEYMSVFPA